MNNKLFNVQDWKYHCQTDAGFLLSSDVSTFENEIYVNDKKISSLIFPDSSLHLTYSYNFILLRMLPNIYAEYKKCYKNNMC